MQHPFLFAQFWGRIEILCHESIHVELTRNRQGKILLDFLRCLESKRVRLVDRAWQRAIGEVVVLRSSSRSTIIQFKRFVEQYEKLPRIREWVSPLESLLGDTRFRRARLRVLQYGVVVHAMIDTLDPKHHTTRDRPGYPQ